MTRGSVGEAYRATAEVILSSPGLPRVRARPSRRLTTLALMNELGNGPGQSPRA